MWSAGAGGLVLDMCGFDSFRHVLSYFRHVNRDDAEGARFRSRSNVCDWCSRAGNAKWSRLYAISSHGSLAMFGRQLLGHGKLKDEVEEIEGARFRSRSTVCDWCSRAGNAKWSRLCETNCNGSLAMFGRQLLGHGKLKDKVEDIVHNQLCACSPAFVVMMT